MSKSTSSRNLLSNHNPPLSLDDQQTPNCLLPSTGSMLSMSHRHQQCHPTNRTARHAMPTITTLHVPLEMAAHIIIRPPSTRPNRPTSREIHISLRPNKITTTMDTMMTRTSAKPIMSMKTKSLKTGPKNVQTRIWTPSDTTNGTSTKDTSDTTTTTARKSALDPAL